MKNSELLPLLMGVFPLPLPLLSLYISTLQGTPVLAAISDTVNPPPGGPGVVITKSFSNPAACIKRINGKGVFSLGVAVVKD